MKSAADAVAIANRKMSNRATEAVEMIRKQFKDERRMSALNKSHDLINMTGRNMAIDTQTSQPDGARSFLSLFYFEFLNIHDKSFLLPRLPNDENRKIDAEDEVEDSPSAMTSGRFSNAAYMAIERMSTGNLKTKDIKLSSLVDANGEWAIHPQDQFYTKRFTLILILVVYNAVMLPFDLMFSEEAKGGGFTFWFETLIDFIFMADLIITFRVGFIDDDSGKVVVTRKRISRRYLKGTFCIDFISSLPFDIILYIFSSENVDSSLSYLSLCKTFRLLRIGRLASYAANNMNVVSFIRIFRILALFSLSAHWGGCAFYLIMKSAWSEDRPSWLASSVNQLGYTSPHENATFSYVQCKDDDSDENCFSVPYSDQYWIVMYTSMMIMMGDSVDTQNSIERIFAVFMTLIGACLTAMMFGQMAQIISGFDREEARYEEFMGQIRDQTAHMRIHPETKTRLVDYYEFQWRVNSGMDRKKFLDSLSPCLRLEILLSVYADVVQKVPFFHVPEIPDFVCFVVERLQEVFYLPSDVIVHEGEISSSLCSIHFITSGSVAVYHPKRPDRIINTLGEGDYFGEMAYLDLTARRTSSVCAVTNCDIALLKYGDIDDLAACFPSFKRELERAVKNKYKILKKTDHRMKSQDNDFDGESSSVERKKSVIPSGEHPSIIEESNAGISIASIPKRQASNSTDVTEPMSVSPRMSERRERKTSLTRSPRGSFDDGPRGGTSRYSREAFSATMGTEARLAMHDIRQKE